MKTWQGVPIREVEDLLNKAVKEINISHPQPQEKEMTPEDQEKLDAAMAGLDAGQKRAVQEMLDRAQKPPTAYMRPEEAVQMMNRCKQEIKDLRLQISWLQPKADAYDNICKILHLLPSKSQPHGEDLVWVLDKRINELNGDKK